MVISLQFTAFDIQYGYSDCRFDHLTITDGDGSTLMEKSCGGGYSDYIDYDYDVIVGGQSIGSSFPAAIRSSSNVVKLLFITGRQYPSDTYSGWSVSWSAVTPGSEEG